jgi:hypothetical protein
MAGLILYIELHRYTHCSGATQGILEMKKAIISITFLLASLVANASCIGSDAYKTCTDSSGNSYNVQRYGNTTNVQGTNAENGSSWNQTSSTYGNTTQTNGTAANGQSWNSTTISSPGMTQQFGTDSQGNSFSKTCTQFGCY